MTETKWTPVTVTVPEWAVSEILQRASELAAKEHGASGSEALTDRELKEAYYGGSSALWRAFLRALAQESAASRKAGGDGWVDWPVLYNTISIGAKEASGVLGAAKKRLKGRMPFEQTQERDIYKFRMGTETAEMIFAFLAADRA